MPSRVLGAWWLFAMLAGCGAAPIVRDASRCDATRSTDEAPRDALHAAIVAAERGALDRLVGRYTRGQLPAYGGRIRARGGLGPEVIDGEVIAAMSRYRGQLFVVELLREHDYFILEQRPESPATTVATPVHNRFTAGGWPFSCVRCTADLASVPRHIDMPRSPMHAPGRSPLVLAGSLTRLPPAALTLDDIRALVSVTEGTDVHRVLDSLELDDGVWTRAVTGTAGIPTTAPGLATEEHPECARVADYAAEWWIDDACVSRYGVRNVRIVRTARRCCAERHAQPSPCSAPPPPDCVEQR